MSGFLYSSVRCPLSGEWLSVSGMMADFFHFVFSLLRPERNSVILTFALGEDTTNKGRGHKVFLPADTKISDVFFISWPVKISLFSPGIFRVVMSLPHVKIAKIKHYFFVISLSPFGTK